MQNSSELGQQMTDTALQVRCGSCSSVINGAWPDERTLAGRPERLPSAVGPAKTARLPCQDAVTALLSLSSLLPGNKACMQQPGSSGERALERCTCCCVLRRYWRAWRSAPDPAGAAAARQAVQLPQMPPAASPERGTTPDSPTSGPECKLCSAQPFKGPAPGKFLVARGKVIVQAPTFTMLQHMPWPNSACH